MEKVKLLSGKNILITGSARRIGKSMALFLAQKGATIILHHGKSPEEAEQTQRSIQAYGMESYIIQADLNDPQQVSQLIEKAVGIGPLFALINNASIFKPLKFLDTSLEQWNEHLNVNLTAPFLLSQRFASALAQGSQGRIINILDWRALRPASDHFPYTISKAALASLTYSLAAALAPAIIVNGLALGAILPPSDGANLSNLVNEIPVGRWGSLEEVNQTILFLLTCPGYITGQIIHLDGGRHLI